MTIRARVLNQKRLEKKLRQIPLDQRKELSEAIKISALEVKGAAVRSIQRGPKTGNIYTTRFFTDPQGRVRPIGKRPPHQASAPGEAPASDTGRLAGSVFAEIDTDKLGADVGTNLAYGTYLEFGTRPTSERPGLAARPWLFPAFERLKKRIKTRIAKAAEQALRRSAR